jgi:hypothetical protein
MGIASRLAFLTLMSFAGRDYRRLLAFCSLVLQFSRYEYSL